MAAQVYYPVVTASNQFDPSIKYNLTGPYTKVRFDSPLGVAAGKPGAESQAVCRPGGQMQCGLVATAATHLQEAVAAARSQDMQIKPVWPMANTRLAIPSLLRREVQGNFGLRRQVDEDPPFLPPNSAVDNTDQYTIAQTQSDTTQMGCAPDVLAAVTAVPFPCMQCKSDNAHA